jgi:hypothetical protein
MDQIAGILTRNEIPFQVDSDGAEYRVLFGSSAVFISVRAWAEGTVVHMRAPVIIGFELEPHMGTAYFAVNDLNYELYFAKFCVLAGEDRGSISVEHDLLGDDLQASELMNALELLAQLADDNDDRLQADIGGRTYAQMLAAPEDQLLET